MIITGDNSQPIEPEDSRSSPAADRSQAALESGVSRLVRLNILGLHLDRWLTLDKPGKTTSRRPVPGGSFPYPLDNFDKPKPGLRPRPTCKHRFAHHNDRS